MMKSREILYFVIVTSFLLLTPAMAQQGPPPGVYVVGDGVKAPVPLVQPLPAYTDEARAAHVEGSVTLQVIIRKDGQVDSFKVIRGLGYGLDESAINTIASKWRFAPGTLNGEPVDVQAHIQVSFRLYGNPAEIESLKPYTSRVQIVSSQWNGAASSNNDGSGYGNVWEGTAGSGFIYQCSCKQPFSPRFYAGQWIERGSILELALGYDSSTGKQKTCELKVHTQKTTYTMRDGQVVPLE